MKNSIKIEKEYLIFRDQTQNFKKIILEKLRESMTNQIYLDFSNVHFISRSFADELLNVINYFQEKNKKIKIINENSSIRYLLKIVEDGKKKIKSEISL